MNTAVLANRDIVLEQLRIARESFPNNLPVGIRHDVFGNWSNKLRQHPKSKVGSCLVVGAFNK